MITHEQVKEAILEGIDNAHDMDATHQDYAESAAKLVMELIGAEVARLTAEREAAVDALRDRFAGQAMAAFIIASEMNGADTAETAYAFADSMLEARKDIPK